MLEQEPDSPGPEGVEHHGVGAESGEHDDRRWAVVLAAQVPQRRDAVRPRHPDVEQVNGLGAAWLLGQTRQERLLLPM
ncbi:hypothetical protein GCM10009616_37250 [Microlunatus lacustris]